MWVNEQTCGECHSQHIYAMNRNLMQTEAGKIQGAVWGWGALTGYKSIYGNYRLDDPEGSSPVRAMVAAGNAFDLIPVSDTEHSSLLNKDIPLSALSRLAAPIALAALLALIFIIFKQQKQIRSLNMP